MIECSSEMKKYHDKKVTLSTNDQGEMRGRRDAGRTRLINGLDRNGHPKPREQASQGSYAMRTMVQDPELDYDIDDGAYFRKSDLKDANGNDLTPAQARARVCKALEDDRLKHVAEVHHNCVRQRYPEGYHIDIPVYRISTEKDADGKEVEFFELASGDNWTRSDARKVTKWFANIVGSLNEGEEDGSQLRRVTRLTKKYARSRKDWKEKVPSGISLTVLVVECFIPKTDKDDVSLRETWKAIKTRLDNSTKIAHPVNASNLAEEGDAQVVFFRDRLGDALKDLQVLDGQDTSLADARKAWDKVFDTTFFSDQPTDDGTKKNEGGGSPFIVTSDRSSQRDDGGRRFG